MGQTPRKEGPKDPRSEPMGPYAAPLPTEVERTEGEPMAVANDKETVHGEAFHPTTASTDAYDPEVARRWRQVPGREAVQESFTVNPRDKPMTKEMERHPPGHGETDARGFKHPELEERRTEE